MNRPRTEGQKGGEFYTPASIVKLIVEILSKKSESHYHIGAIFEELPILVYDVRYSEH